MYIISEYYAVNILAYRPVAKRWLCKQWPLLCNAATYTYAVTSLNNRRGAAKAFSVSLLRGYDSTDPVQFSEWVQCSWGFSCEVLTSGQQKLKIRNQHTSSENTAEE
jgi:hypothetical protein